MQRATCIVENCTYACMRQRAVNSLHDMCSQLTAFNHQMLKNLIAAYPDVIKERNEDGYIPVHSAIKNQCHMTAIKILTDCWPESLQVPDVKGRLCIHLACKYSKTLLIQYVYNQLPNAINWKDSNGNYPLHHIIRHCMAHDHDFIETIMNASPEAVFTRNQNGDLPIHLVCQHAQQHEEDNLLIHTVLQIWPQSTMEENGDGMLPLHVLCKQYESFAMLCQLVDYHPDAVMVKDRVLEQSPLHYAVSREPQKQVFLTNVLVRANSKCVHMKDINGNLPIHTLLLLGGVDIRVVELLVETWPESLSDANKEGMLPLHIACCHTQSHIVLYILDNYPKAAQAIDKSGYMPLHYACSNTVPLSTDAMGRLINACPDSCTMETLLL